MASSDKPDFIEIDQEEAPVKLMMGADKGAPPVTPPATAMPEGASPGNARDVQLAAPVSSTASPALKKALQEKVNDDTFSIPKKSLPPRKSLRKLPGGWFFFTGLMVLICLTGSRLQEVRNQTLTNLATVFFIDQRGFVETVADLSYTYALANNVSAAKQVLDKALINLNSKGQDKGAKGAFLRLKYALLDSLNDDPVEAKKHALKALEMLKAGGTYVPYETGFLLHEVALQFDNNWDYQNGEMFNQKALDIWPRERPNYRAEVVANIGFEYNRMKQFEKAERALKEALNHSLRQGSTFANVWRYTQLGQAQVGQKKYMEAEVNLLAALRMESGLRKGRKTTQLARIFTELGKVKAGMGDMKSAQDYLEWSARILKKKKDQDYYYLINQLELANVYRDTGHPEKARPLYGELLRRLNDGESGPSLKDVNREFDLLLAQTGGK